MPAGIDVGYNESTTPEAASGVAPQRMRAFLNRLVARRTLHFLSPPGRECNCQAFLIFGGSESASAVAWANAAASSATSVDLLEVGDAVLF